MSIISQLQAQGTSGQPQSFVPVSPIPTSTTAQSAPTAINQTPEPPINSVAASSGPKKFRSGRQSAFYFVLGLFFLSGVAVAAFKGMNFVYDKKIADKQEIVGKIEAELAKLGAAERYNKLEFARYIEKNRASMPRSERIDTIVSVLQELKDVSYEGSNSIRLFDFTVDLERMTLKGEVSNIALLYHSSEARGYVSLIDTFKNLDFVEEVSIKQYTTVGGLVSFTLVANLTLNE